MAKVFVLGDSRTGTTTIHKYLQTLGYNSIHYYFKDSGVLEYNENLGEYKDYIKENWIKMKKFIDESGYDAFSDYPTRIFYEELMGHYKDGFFILTKRKNTKIWQESMLSFMGKHNISIDIDILTGHYERINSAIRKKSKEYSIRFCEINIDQDDKNISRKLSSFFNLKRNISIGHENSSSQYNVRLWSGRTSLFDIKDGDPVSYVEKSCHPHKGTLSENGWVFLINDSSYFLEYFYGRKNWTVEEKNRAASTLKQRRSKLEKDGILYRKYIIPEKSSVYEDYMPRVLSKIPVNKSRPAAQIEEEEFSFYSYLNDILKDVRPYGHVYFKGDSHPNWLGAYFIYHHIVETMNADMKNKHVARPPIKLSELSASLVGYKGDIAEQLPSDQKRVISTTWGDISYEDIFEYTTRYELPEALYLAKKVYAGSAYSKNIKNRETLAFSMPDSNLPKAVIFRDSTSDHFIDLLAQHFSRSLFIWHNGLLYKDIIENEKPDIVLHIQAERFFVQYKEYPVFSELFKESN